MWRIIRLILGLLEKSGPVVGPPPPQGDEATVCLDEHNRIRESYAFDPFVGDGCLAAQAQLHAEWMRKNRRLTHDGFAGRLTTCTRQPGSENIAEGFMTGKSVVEGWMNSAGHRANILKPSYRRVGIGYDGGYWCAIYTYGD